MITQTPCPVCGQIVPVRPDGSIVPHRFDKYDKRKGHTKGDSCKGAKS